MRVAPYAKAVAAVGAATLLTSACLSSSSSTSSSSDTGSAAPGSASGSTSASSPAAGGGKTKIDIMFGFGGDQTQGFKDSLDPWAKAHNIEIQYDQAASFDTLIRTRVAGNNLPDIAIFPQPGLLKDMAKTGKMQALDSVLDMTKLKASDVPGFIEAATMDGKVFGAPIGINVKSLIWTDTKNFAAAGLKQPTTLDELLTMSDTMATAGKTPWCVGLESGGATGWPGTDWIEELVLKQQGPDVYDQWVNHTVKFSDPRIKAAFDTYMKIMSTKGWVNGGQQSIVGSAFGTAANPLFTTPPKCYMHKQGNFISQKGFFPESVRSALDATATVYPFPKDKFDTVEGGGDIASMFTAGDANVTAVMKYITEDPTFGKPWAGPTDRGFISPHKDFDVANYGNETTRSIAKIAYTASGMRFDGSDLMPGKVGAGSFWKGMVALTSGKQDVATTLKQIDDSWPAS